MDVRLVLTTAILAIAFTLMLSISNVNAIVVNNTDFSIEVPDGWVYRENILFDSTLVLTPKEFANVLIMEDSLKVPDILQGGIIVVLARDPSFPIKNAPLETYVQHVLRSLDTVTPKHVNATIGGERAIKVFINGTDLIRNTDNPNITSRINVVSYIVLHNDQPYYLHYMANTNDYKKYLPEFEQIVKTFKFAK